MKLHVVTAIRKIRLDQQRETTRNGLPPPPRLKQFSECDRHIADVKTISLALSGDPCNLVSKRDTRMTRTEGLLSGGGAGQGMRVRLSFVAVQ